MRDHITWSSADSTEPPAQPARGPAARGSQTAMRLVTFAVRATRILTFATMAVLEPLVRFILMTLATLGMFVTIVFGFLMGAESFPKWLMLGMSVGCFLLLGAYYAVMGVFGRASTERNSDSTP